MTYQVRFIHDWPRWRKIVARLRRRELPPRRIERIYGTPDPELPSLWFSDVIEYWDVPQVTTREHR